MSKKDNLIVINNLNDLFTTLILPKEKIKNLK
jgi:hypothetical protein